MESSRRPKRYTDPFTASAGAGVALVIGAGFIFAGIHALATGCISLARGRHGPGVLHCAPETSYWTATTVFALLGCALLFASWKFLRLARRRPGADRAGR